MSFTSAQRREVHLVAGARAVSVCGDVLAATALALALQAAGAGGLVVSGLLLASTAPLVLFAPLAGRIADRVDSRRLLVGVGLAQAAICAALAFVGDPAALMVLVVLLATGLAITQPTLSALLPEIAGRANLARASAINQTVGAVGMLVAPALAGLLVGKFGVRVPLLLDAASYLALVAAGLLLRTRRGGRTRPGHAGAAGAPAVGPTWRLSADPLLRATIASLVAVILAVSAINVVAVFFIRDTLGASPTVYGLVSAAWMAGILAGGWLAGAAAGRARDDGALVTGLLAQLGGTAAVIALAALADAPGWLIPLWLVGGVLNGGTTILIVLVLTSRVPAAQRGRAFAALGAAVQGASMAGYLAGGVLLAHVQPRHLVAGLGLAGLAVVTALVHPVRRAIRRERGSAAGPAPAAADAGRYGWAAGAVVPAPSRK